MYVWDKRTNEVHDASKNDPRCRLGSIPADQRKEYADEHTATTVVKTQHLIPCRWCYRPGGRSTMHEGAATKR